MVDCEQGPDSDPTHELHRTSRMQEVVEARERVRNICEEIPKQEELRRSALSQLIDLYCKMRTGMTLHTITSVAQVSYSAVRAFLRRENHSLSLETYMRLSGALNVPLVQLLGISPDEDRKSPFIDIQTYEYPYNLNVDKREVYQVERFNRSWIVRITNSIPENLCMVHITNNDMYPEIPDGHNLLIDISVHAARENGLYTIDHRGYALLRRIEVDIGDKDKLYVSNIGEKWSTAPLTVKAADLCVVGHVVWGCHRM